MARGRTEAAVTVTDLQDPPAAFDDYGYEYLARFSNGVSLWYRGHYSETDRHIAAVRGGLIGHFLWDRESGRISAVHVHPSFRRRGQLDADVDLDDRHRNDYHVRARQRRGSVH